MVVDSVCSVASDVAGISSSMLRTGEVVGESLGPCMMMMGRQNYNPQDFERSAAALGLVEGRSDGFRPVVARHALWRLNYFARFHWLDDAFPTL